MTELTYPRWPQVPTTQDTSVNGHTTYHAKLLDAQNNTYIIIGSQILHVDRFHVFQHTFTLAMNLQAVFLIQLQLMLQSVQAACAVLCSDSEARIERSDPYLWPQNPYSCTWHPALLCCS